MTEYNLAYRGVTCIAVDWDESLFYFRYAGELWVYPAIGYISFSADTDHIRFVIDGFLAFVMHNSGRRVRMFRYTRIMRKAEGGKEK